MPTWIDWLRDPRTGVLIVLGVIAVVGTARKLLQGRRARAMANRLAADQAEPADIAESWRHGREVLIELFRLLTEAQGERFEAAGRALARLWAGDQLVAQEEQAVVRRGWRVAWEARRVYPRDLTGPLMVTIRHGLSFLGPAGQTGPRHRPQSSEPPIVRQDQLEWSFQVAGSRRAGLEVWSPWKPGPPEPIVVPIDPADFPERGPHRLILKVRVRALATRAPRETATLNPRDDETGVVWSIELPHLAHPLEFDPSLRVESILAPADADRAEAIARVLRFDAAEPRRWTESDVADEPRFWPISTAWALRDPPRLRVVGPVPRDLAHRVALEFDLPDAPAIPLGRLIALNDADPPPTPESPTPMEHEEHFESEPPTDRVLPIERAGPLRVRAVLTPDPQRAWSVPGVRSLWPETIRTPWVEVEAVRR